MALFSEYVDFPVTCLVNRFPENVRDAKNYEVEKSIKKGKK